MELQIIGTGSSGNAYVLRSDDGCLLLDAGLPYAEIMQGLVFDTSSLRGALITHSHMDHARAMPNLLAAGIDVYATSETSRAIMGEAMPYALHTFLVGHRFDVGNWQVKSFETEHDVSGAVGFLLRSGLSGQRVLYLTDSYYCKYKFSGLTHIVVECNHNSEIIEKRWKAGKIAPDMYLRLKRSHFSLERLLIYLKALDLSRCVKIVLVHLSDENSNESKMVSEVHFQTGIDTVAARAGMTINFDLCPF